MSEDSYTSLVDTKELKNFICNRCVFTVRDRQLHCDACGHTKYFRGGDLLEDNGKYYLVGKEIQIKT